MYFSAAASSENDHGSMNLASNTAPLASHPAIERRRHPAEPWMPDMRLHVRNDLPGIGLVPAPVEVLGDGPKLDNEVAREVLRLDLTALLAPKAQQGALVLAHNDPGVGAADKVSSVSAGVLTRSAVS